jgi:hypothetical protein
MHELLLWQNVIFWAPMVVGTLLYGLSSVMGGDGGHDQDAAEVDVHADIPSNVSAGAEAHVEAGHGDVNPDQDAVLTGSVWSYFGLGKVPLAAVLASLMFGWGIAGLVLNLTIGVPRITLSLFIAAAFSLAFTRIVSRLIARYVPSYQSYSHSGARLFLTEGEVLYTVSAKSGTVRVLDRFNNLRDLDSRVRPGEPAIAKGEKVYIDDYDEHSHTYFVRSSVQ